MVTARTPRTDWVDAGLRALAAGGPDAVRVEALAKDLGVTKGGFYWHFADRAALLGELVDSWEQRCVDDVIDQIEGGADTDARARLQHLFELATEGSDLLLIDLAVRDWARRDPAIADRLAGADDRRMTYLRRLVGGFVADEEDVEARAFIAFCLWIGNHFIAATHGTRDRAQVLELVMARLLA